MTDKEIKEEVKTEAPAPVEVKADAKKGKLKQTAWRVYNPKQTARLQTVKCAGRGYLFWNQPKGGLQGNLMSMDKEFEPVIDYFVKELGYKKEKFMRAI